jgi:hypothetical protein
MQHLKTLLCLPWQLPAAVLLLLLKAPPALALQMRLAAGAGAARLLALSLGTQLTYAQSASSSRKGRRRQHPTSPRQPPGAGVNSSNSRLPRHLPLGAAGASRQVPAQMPL